MNECCGQEGFHQLHCEHHPLFNHFPVTPGEARSWEALRLLYPLAMRVLVVAQTRIEGAWCAYADFVPGQNHVLEAELVLAHGDKLEEGVALAMFPSLRGVPYAR